MWLFYLYFTVFHLSSISLADWSSASAIRLSRQCWREWPLFSADIQSSSDGLTELVFDGSQHSSSRFDGGSSINSGPWTYAPVCTRLLESLGSQLCVYTNRSFSNGRGISIFTTPRIAKEFAALPAFQHPQAQDINTFSGAWYTRELPGKGMGMMAKKQLNFGDRVTAYTPALIAHLEQELSTLEREKYFRIAISQLPRPLQDRFLKLATVYGDPRIKVQDVVKANTFQLHAGGQDHLAVFPETARLNHACAPNAQYVLDPVHLTHTVAATRPIEPDEEITISYTSPLEPTDMRQRHLSDGFHFTCSCPRCIARDKSDATLQRMMDMQKVLNDWQPTSMASPKLAEKMLQLYRDEGLEGFLDIPYGFAALAYNAVGDSNKAEKYAKAAQEAILMKDGPWTANMQIWNEMLENPKRHWSFRARSR
ncbi:hypothetical protein BCR34DRAFT_590600 [Clohesyomyces aquaticus]|uniref:SET domain-containing protein n=1 Tax=Clohesyomyces aquaticus TaxID=1231657 RepID=A0A1Y1Z8C7_9PLEO|nr:hypothetical protein BCR34DRAFT_590600 [Clohesyomyces aquaticus]